MNVSFFKDDRMCELGEILLDIPSLNKPLMKAYHLFQTGTFFTDFARR